MKRTIDQHYFTYSVHSAAMTGIHVKCPKCGGPGIVTADGDSAYFKCTNCGHSKTKERTIYRYDVHNQCSQCGRYYRVDITNKNKQLFSMLHVACPYCGYMMQGEVHQTAESLLYIGEIKNGCEPFFGFALWFLKFFDNRPVWALNREHLAYLIGYLSAGLREKPNTSNGMKTQADQLPTFMKTAKNRNRIVKLLQSMQKSE